MGFFDKFNQEKKIDSNKGVSEEQKIKEQIFKEVPEEPKEFQPEKVEKEITHEDIKTINEMKKETENNQHKERKVIRRTNINAQPKTKKSNVPIHMSDMSEKSLETEEDIINEIKDLSVIHTSWRDYCLMMLNSTADPLRSIWREKIVTSFEHWNFGSGSISDGNIAGIEILTVLPSKLTEKLVDDHFEADGWYKMERLNRSKRMNVFVGHYGQESFSNEANICLKYLIKNFDEKIEEADGLTGAEIIANTPLLYRIWDVAQKSEGKCINDDELLTYLLEKNVDDSKYGVWLDVCEDVFENGIPSDKYKDYWKSEKIDSYPLAISGDEKFEYYKNTESKEKVGLEEQKEYFTDLCDVFLKENVSWAACFKKICICILKNDVSMKYAGFSATLRERLAREDAMAAFSTKQEEKAKAKENAEALAAKIEKENKENNK